MHRLSARRSSPIVSSPARAAILLVAAAGLSLAGGCTSSSKPTGDREGVHDNIRGIERDEVQTKFGTAAIGSGEAWRANFDDKLWYISCGAEMPERVRVVRCQGEHPNVIGFWPSTQVLTPGSLSNPEFSTAQFDGDNAFLLFWLNDEGQWVPVSASEGNANFELKDRGAGIRFSWVRPGCFVDLHCK